MNKYATENLSRVNPPQAFRKSIKVTYPPNNTQIFEEWFRDNYVGCDTDRVYLDLFLTSYWVNNDYGNNARAKQELQEYINELDKSKKYFVICQYDDGVLVNWNGLDVLEFNMSKNIGVQLPLIGMPHPYKFSGGKKWLASFVGGRTHPIRNELEKLKAKDGYYISFEPHDIETYCRIIHESIFTLCPRGYGLNSFRATEALQYGSVPVYISDDFIHPFDLRFNDYGVVLNSRHINFLDEELVGIEPYEIIQKQEKGQKIYQDYYTYQGCFNHIIKTLETEHHKGELNGAFSQSL